jgi:hypothetical protein
MSKTNHAFLLALSGVQTDILPYLILAMMMNRFLGRSRYWGRYLQPQRPDDQVLVMLRMMLYSEYPFVDPEFRLRLMSRFGLTIFLVKSLMRPGVKLDCLVNLSFFQAIDRVKRGFLSPPQQIVSALTILSKPFFQIPLFELSFSIEGFPELYDELRLDLMKFLLLSIPADFAGLPEFLALVRHLMLTDNPFWESLEFVFICNSLDRKLDQSNHSDIERYYPQAFQNFSTTIESSPDSEGLKIFERLFQPEEHGQVLVPNDRDSFLKVVERFITDMFNILPSLPGVRFENKVIKFWQRHKLSEEGIVLSQRIMDKLRLVHSLNIPVFLIELLSVMNFEDSPECLVYRAFELLLNLLKLIQESNGVIYTYIHACILIQTSTEPHKIRELCALRDLFTIVTFSLNDERPETTRYDRKSLLYCSYLLKKKEQSDLEKFLIECLLEPDFLKTLNDLLQCSDESDLEDFAQSFMKNLGLVRLFRRYIQENSKTWC